MTLASLDLSAHGCEALKDADSPQAQALQHAIAIQQGEVVDDVLRQELAL
jgi:hypothetical protein